MGYRIEYEPELNKKYPKKTQLRPVHIISVCAVAVVLVFLLSSGGIYTLRNLFLPDDAAAFSNMVDSVRAGTSLQEAITAFCREILYSAG